MPISLEIANIDVGLWQSRSPVVRRLSIASEGEQAVSQEHLQATLDALIDLSRPLVKFTSGMPWAQIEVVVSAMQLTAAAGASRPVLPIRLVSGLLYLKHAYILSNNATCERWQENRYCQNFTGEVYFQTRLSFDPSSSKRWHNRLGKVGLKAHLAQAIEAAKTKREVTTNALRWVIVDTTVQEIATAHPADNWLLEIAHCKLMKLAQQEGFIRRQCYECERLKLRCRAGASTHDKYFKRWIRVLRRQRKVFGRLIRGIERMVDPEPVSSSLRAMLERVAQLRAQHRKAKDGLYALHASKVECTSKGKSRHPCQFGVKVGIAITSRGGLNMGARSFPGNTYDGDTLSEQFEQADILSNETLRTVTVGLGGRGRCLEGVEILHCGKHKRLTRRLWSWVKRRQAIVPVIGRLIDDCRFGGNPLKGALNYSPHVLVCAAGYKLDWFLRWIAFFWVSTLRFLSGTLAPPDQETGIKAA